MKNFLLVKLLVVSLLAPLSFSASAVKLNYFGVVTRVSILDDTGSFVVTINTNEFDDCLYKYAYFMVNRIGEKRTQMAYTMALTSLTTKMKMNFVMDKEDKGAQGQCYVTGMVSGIQSN
ncbi:MAG: hypothetical protein HRT35_01080 [Algicola sp.]|nr:hypothetical protein [Algicola sp.]